MNSWTAFLITTTIRITPIVRLNSIVEGLIRYYCKKMKKKEREEIQVVKLYVGTILLAVWLI